MIDYTLLDSYVFGAINFGLGVGVLVGAIFALSRKFS